MPWLADRPDDPRPDEALCAASRAGTDPAALGILYARYLELVYGVCLRYLGDAHRAEDATMEVYEHLAAQVQRLEIGAFRPYLYTVARNHCLMALRRDRTRVALVPVGSGTPAPGGAPLSPLDVQSDPAAHPFGASANGEAAAGHEADLEALERCCEGLPAGQAECIRRFYLAGESYADIAAALDWPPRQVRSALQNGRRNLRGCMQRSRPNHA